MRARSAHWKRTAGSMFGGDTPSVATIERELAGRVPVDGALPLEHLGELAEERDALERVVASRAAAAHVAVLRRPRTHGRQERRGLHPHARIDGAP